MESSCITCKYYDKLNHSCLYGHSINDCAGSCYFRTEWEEYDGKQINENN